MSEYRFEQRQRVERPLAEVFEFFSRPENLERITPGFLRFELTGEVPESVGEGTLISYRLRLHGVPVRWLTRIERWNPPHEFADEQIRGPYRLWHHTHRFAAVDGGAATELTDVVRYAHRFGPLGAIAEHMFVRRDVERIFAYRAAAIERIVGDGALDAARSA